MASKEKVSATSTLIYGDSPRTVIIGGPGQGKSTLGQFIAQIHRAHLLQRAHDLNGDHLKFLPTTVRIPFRIILKDYAQAITEGPGPHSLEFYIASSFGDRAGRAVSAETVQDIFKANPTLLILDGLDEVTDRTLRDRMLQYLSEFISRADDVLHADLQIVATSRPTGYSDQFDPSRFLHLELAAMDATRVHEYTEKWIKAKNLEQGKATTLKLAIKECVEDPQFSPLMNTPLQVTIFVLIVLGGGLPPRQREELFNEYLEVIYKRERAKSKTIIQTEKRLLFGLHQYLGYVLHLRASGTEDIRSRLKEEEFAEAVLRYLQQMDPYTPAVELKKRASQMIMEAQERLVLLVSPEPGLFGFELRSIQEFFAASYLVDTARDHRQLFNRFEAIALPPHWRYVALFFAGRVGRLQPGSALQILEACREIDRHKPDYYLKRGAWLALEIALDRSFGPDRILQRATLEYALTVLDGAPNSDAREQLVTRLRQLPSDDLDHVRPLLRQRLDRVKLPEDWATIEVFSSLTQDRGPVEALFEASLQSGSTTPRELVVHSIENELSPQFCAKLVRAWGKPPEDDLSDVLWRTFAVRPQYVAAILRSVKLPLTVAVQILYLAFRQPLLNWHLRPNLEFLEEVPSDEFGEIALAYLIGSFALVYGPSRSSPPWHDEARYWVRFGLSSKSSAVIEKLATHLMSAATIELKAAALALIMKIAPVGQAPRPLIDAGAKLFKPHEVESADRVLFSCESLSLEAIAGLRKEGPHRWLGRQRVLGDFAEDELPVEAFDAGVPLRANIDETVLLVVITEQGENRNQCEEQRNLFGFLHGFARRGT